MSQIHRIIILHIAGLLSTYDYVTISNAVVSFKSFKILLVLAYILLKLATFRKKAVLYLLK